MAKQKRGEDEAGRQRVEIVRRYLQGETQEQIAESLGLSQSQISLDLRVAKQQWRQQYARDVQEVIQEEIARIRLMESESWRGWNESQQVKESTTHRTIVKGDFETEETTVTREKSCGNPAFLTVLLACIEKRCKLMGVSTHLRLRDIDAAVKLLKSRGYKVFKPDDGDLAISLHNLVDAGIIPPQSVDDVLAAIVKSNGIMQEELRQAFNKSDRALVGVGVEEVAE